MVKIGVIAVQGAFAEHASALRRAAEADGRQIEVLQVRRPSQAEACQGFVLPGGESTTIHKLLRSSGLFGHLQQRVGEGAPLLATCAGAILAAKEGDGQVEATGTELLGLMDTSVDRNAFGRQKESFEAPLSIEALGEPPFPGVFIRAPGFRSLGGQARPWARLPGGEVVGVEQGGVLALSFHPELSPDTRIHSYFLDKVEAHLPPAKGP